MQAVREELQAFRGHTHGVGDALVLELELQLQEVTPLEGEGGSGDQCQP